MIYKITLPALSLLMISCATSPVTLEKAKPVPADRILYRNTEKQPELGEIIVIRDSGFIGSGCYYALYIDGVLAARLDPSEFVRLYLVPGERILKASRDPMGRGLCGADSDNWTQRETIIKASESKKFRLTIDANGKLDIMRSD